MTLSPEFLQMLMRASLEEARKAFEIGEVPVGAVISDGSTILATAHNTVESSRDATCHAEMFAIKKASAILDNWRLNDLILCVTLEPCTMCLGAIKQSRISTLVFGAYDERFGACGSLYDLSVDTRSGLVPRVISGVMKEECVGLMRGFFEGRRKRVIDERPMAYPPTP